MQPASSDRRSTYLDALTLEIERKLRKALSSPGQRPDLLQKLFADVALGIDDRAFDIIFNKDEDQIATANYGIDICFYDVLADYYVEAPEKGKCVLDLIVQLWSQSFVSHIFALLFHKWLFEVSVENTEALLRYGSALVQGAGNVFWIDIQTNRRRFLSLFTYLLEEVALVPEQSVKISLQARRDLYLLLSRFLFFYDADGSLEIFLKNFPTSPNAFLIGGPADIFVIELTDQLQKLKVEPVLVHYLARMSAIRGLTCVRQLNFPVQCSKLPTESNYLLGLELRMTTSTRLKACLYSFTSPGGPMYPTRVARHAAWDTLDLLFPVGRYPRHVISLFFRLLYPWYWPFSCWNFVMTCVKTVVYYFIGVLTSSWESFRKPKSR